MNIVPGKAPFDPKNTRIKGQYTYDPPQPLAVSKKVSESETSIVPGAAASKREQHATSS
jgi:hypothetical protein